MRLTPNLGLQWLGILCLAVVGTNANCSVPDSWGPLVVSSCTPGASLTTGAVCTQSCPSPSNQYTSSGSGTATCEADGSWTGFTLQCAPLGDDLSLLPVWCGSDTESYLNGFTYIQVHCDFAQDFDIRNPAILTMLK